MNFDTLLAVFAVIIGSIVGFRLDSIAKIRGSDRIVNGIMARPGQFPYVALRVVITNVMKKLSFETHTLKTIIEFVNLRAHGWLQEAHIKKQSTPNF